MYIPLFTPEIYPLKVFTEIVNNEAKARQATEDDPADSVVTFKMRHLSTEELKKLDDQIMISNKKGDTGYQLGTIRYSRLHKCVRGWENIHEDVAKAKPLQFSDANLDKLPATIIKVLDEHIVDANGMREDSAKNS